MSVRHHYTLGWERYCKVEFPALIGKLVYSWHEMHEIF